MVQVACNLCGRDEWHVRFPATVSFDNGDGIEVDAFRCTNPGYGSHAQIVECNYCGYIYANPRLSEEALLAAYAAVEDSTYVQERIGRELTFRKHLQAMEKVVGSANGRSLLDVGAYIGVFVEVASASGWQAVGVEPSTWAATEAQQQNLPIIQGTLDALELQNEQFDVITMWDVIEHVSDPSAELAKSYERLKPGGWLVVHTMDVSSLAARLMGPRWPWLMDMHLHYFSQKTMAKMLEQHNYHVVWSGAQGRYLRLGYVATRIAAMNGLLGRVAHRFIYGLRLQEVPIPINFGDLFTVYARRPIE